MALSLPSHRGRAHSSATATSCCVSKMLPGKMQHVVKDSTNSVAVFPIINAVAHGGCVLMLKKNTQQCSIRLSHANPNTTAVRNKISMAQTENKDYRDANA